MRRGGKAPLPENGETAAAPRRSPRLTEQQRAADAAVCGAPTAQHAPNPAAGAAAAAEEREEDPPPAELLGRGTRDGRSPCWYGCIRMYRCVRIRDVCIIRRGMST